METFYGTGPGAGLQLTHPSGDYLAQTAKWGKLLAIVGFIGIAFMVLMALLMGTAMSSMIGNNSGAGAAAAFGSGMVTIIYLLFALLYFFPVLYLYRFSAKMQEALHTSNEEALQHSFKNLKSLFKFLGILTIIMLVFWGLGMAGMVFGLSMGAMAQ